MEMINQELLARLYSERLTPTGFREVSDLNDIDAAFCNNILRAFDGVVVSDTRRETRPFNEWLKRAPSDQIIYGEFDDVASFLAAYQSSQTGRSQENSQTQQTRTPHHQR